MVDRELEELEQFYEKFITKYIDVMKERAALLEKSGVQAVQLLNTTQFATNSQDAMISSARAIQQILDDSESVLKKRLVLIRSQMEEQKRLEQYGYRRR